MQDKYIYLTGSLVAFLLVAIIFVLRKDMRSFIIKAGIIGGCLSVITEYWFFQDYWRIPSTFGVATPSIDDFICGFSFVALSVVIYPFVFQLPLGSSGGKWKKSVIPILTFSLLSMIIFVSILKVNSIIMASAVPLLIAVYVLIRRPDLYKRALFGAAFLGALAFVVYFVLFGIISPHYIDKYFLLAHNPLNPIFFGFMPLAELMWYLTMGAVGSVLYEYIVTGNRGKHALAT